MLQFVNIDIFQSHCEALVNPVNCKGVMGAGLAKIFKERFPEMFQEYKSLCDLKVLKPGRLHVWRNGLNNPKWIINFPTKEDWRLPSDLDYILSGLQHLAEVITSNKIKSLALPALGCGLGGLEWDVVKIAIEKILLDHATPEVDKCDLFVAIPQQNGLS